MWLLFAVEQLLGRRLGTTEYDPMAPPALRARQLAALRARAAALVRSAGHPAAAAAAGGPPAGP